MSERPVATQLSVPGSDHQITPAAHALTYQAHITFEILVDSQERDEITDDIARHVYRFPEAFDLLPAFTQSSQPGQRVLDLGAHIGTFTLLAAKLGYQVAAVEASPRNAALLQASIAHNAFDNAQVVPVAVSDRRETLEFVQAGPYGLVATPFQSDPTVSVQAMPVDEIVAHLGWDHVDFIKMDVEGSEVKAVAGMAKLLARADAPIIIFESNGHTLNYFGQTPATLMDALSSFGYHCYLINRHTLMPVRSSDLQGNCTVDYLATKAPLPHIPDWQAGAPLTRGAQISQLIATGTQPHPHQRAYVARTLAGAPRAFLTDVRLLWLLDKLTTDPDPDVRASAAWFHSRVTSRAIPLPFANRHPIIAALQRYLALARCALQR